MIVLLLFGPIASIATAIIHWISLTLTRGWILGPLMKFLAVLPTIIGFWFGVKIYKKFLCKKSSFLLLFVTGNLCGIVLRVLVCSVTNIIVFLVVDPSYLTYAGSILNSVGIAASSALDILLWVLLLTGIFNTLHVLLSSIGASILFKASTIRMPQLAEKTWIFKKE
jgi:hypothetical protein